MKDESKLHGFLNFLCIIPFMIYFGIINIFEFFRLCYYVIMRIPYKSHKDFKFPVWYYTRKDQDNNR